MNPITEATLNIQRLPLATLQPHPRNPRNHPEPDSPAWQVIEASLKHDYFDPIVWNVRNGQLVSGHLRSKVLARLGFTAADCVVVDYDEPTHIARMLAANKLTGEDDVEAQKVLLAELNGTETQAIANTSLWEQKSWKRLHSDPI